MRRAALCLTLLAALSLAQVRAASAKDTDIYRPTVKPNVMIMFDNSGSMDYGVYEYTEDYGNFYDYLSQRTYGGSYEIRDSVTGTGPGPTNYFYGTSGHRTWTRTEVLMLAGDIGYVAGPDGKGYTGDPGDPNYLWYASNMTHTGWVVNTDGTHTISSDAEGYVLYNGQRLPNGRSIKVHDWLRNADGTQVDRGLAGLLKAPGWYFSGYFFNASNQLTSDPAQAKVVNGRKVVVFFIPGNWLSMQCVYNLTVVAGAPDAGQPAWKVRTDESSNFWQTAVYSLTSPSYPANYPNNYHNVWTVTQPGASAVKVHFNAFNTKNSSDPVKLYTADNTLVATYYGSQGAFWSAQAAGSQVKIEFTTNGSGQQTGWSIDSYSYTQASGSGYQMKRRLDVARGAILHVIDATMGKINWGLASFNYNGGSTGNGADILSPLNPNFNDDTNRQNMINHLDALVPGYGTPLCESAQDMYNFFAQHTNILRECTRNYVIYMTDGYPSVDDDNSRLATGVTLTNNPADSFTQDPYQYPVPPVDLFDDAVGYGYRHSVRDGSLIAEPASAYDNVTGHCIGFSLDMPLLADAAADGGGVYYIAFNEQQLVSAFYSLGLLIIQGAGYTAPVVSVDSANRTQSGDEVYMAFFKPMTVGLGYWGGNLKRYGLDMRIKGDCLPTRTQQEWVVVDNPGGAGASDATDCEGEFKETSTSWWDEDALPDGDDVEKGGVGEIIYRLLDLSDPYTRPLYTYSGSFTPFTQANPLVTNSLLGVASDIERYKVINFTYGFTYEENGTSHGPLAKRGWPLGDMVHSEPVIIDYCPPDTPRGCTAVIERYLVVGANDGMLHVFDADSGLEVWSFLPPDLLPKLANFNPSTGVNQQDLVDGPLGLFEYTDGTGAYQKLLVMGERRGGRAYYAINVTDTDPTHWSMQWVNVNSGTGPGIVGGSTPGFEELGQSWSRPQMTKIRIQPGGTSRSVLIFGGGYDPEEDNTTPGTRTMGRAVYVVDLATGELLYHFDHASSAALQCVPADVSVINDVTDCLEYFYFVDSEANIWKTTYTPGAASPWETHRVFASNPGSTAASGYGGTGTGSLDTQDKGRKMFYPPDVSLGNTFTDYPVLYVGTGDREHPMEQAVSNRIYCIIDSIPSGLSYDGSAPLNELHLVNVTGDELEPSASTSTTERSRIQGLIAAADGWYIKLDDQATGNHVGEKVLAQATVFYRIAYFTTFTPVSAEDTCNPLGEAKVYALEYSIGTSSMDYNQNGTQEQGDRFVVIGESIASRVKIIIRSGTAAGLVSVGGKVSGAGAGNSTRLPQPSAAIETILWRELGPAEIAGGAYGN